MQKFIAFITATMMALLIATAPATASNRITPSNVEQTRSIEAKKSHKLLFESSTKLSEHEIRAALDSKFGENFSSKLKVGIIDADGMLLGTKATLEFEGKQDLGEHVVATLKAKAEHIYRGAHQLGGEASVGLQFFERFELGFKVGRGSKPGDDVEFAAEVKVILFEW